MFIENKITENISIISFLARFLPVMLLYLVVSLVEMYSFAIRDLAVVLESISPLRNIEHTFIWPGESFYLQLLL